MFGYEMGFSDTRISAYDIANKIGLVSLTTHLKYSDVVFGYKLLNGIVNCPELLSKIGFDFRNKSSFHGPFSSRNYLNNSPICRLTNLCIDLSCM